jgi:hypothetical protein
VGWPAICSGAMNPGVPMIVPTCVSRSRELRTLSPETPEPF